MFESLLENQFALFYMFTAIIIMVILIRLSALQGKKADIEIHLQSKEYFAGHSIEGTIQLKANSFLKLNDVTVSLNCGQYSRLGNGKRAYLAYYHESKEVSKYDQIPPSDTKVFDFTFFIPTEIKRLQTKIRDKYLSKNILKPIGWLYSYGNPVRKRDIYWFIACNAKGEGFY